MVTFPAAENHCPLASTILYYLVSEARVCEQPVQGHYMNVEWPRVKRWPSDPKARFPLPELTARIDGW